MVDFSNHQDRFEAIIQKLRCDAQSCKCHQQRVGKATTHCPAHSDQHPSLTVNLASGKLLVHCQAGCDQSAVIEELKSRNLWPGRTSPRKPDHPLLTLETLANDKALSQDFLVTLGLHNLSDGRVAIPHRDENGTDVIIKERTALRAKEGSYWPSGTPLMLYGLDRLHEGRASRELILVEGESDCWTLWAEGLPALGILGANAAKVLDLQHLDGICAGRK